MHTKFTHVQKHAYTHMSIIISKSKFIGFGDRNLVSTEQPIQGIKTILKKQIMVYRRNSVQMCILLFRVVFISIKTSDDYIFLLALFFFYIQQNYSLKDYLTLERNVLLDVLE